MPRDVIDHLYEGGCLRQAQRRIKDYKFELVAQTPSGTIIRSST